MITRGHHCVSRLTVTSTQVFSPGVEEPTDSSKSSNSMVISGDIHRLRKLRFVVPPVLALADPDAVEEANDRAAAAEADGSLKDKPDSNFFLPSDLESLRAVILLLTSCQA